MKHSIHRLMLSFVLVCNILLSVSCETGLEMKSCDLGLITRPVPDHDSILEEVGISVQDMITELSGHYRGQMQWSQQRVPPGGASPTEVTVDLSYHNGVPMIVAVESECESYLSLPMRLRLRSEDGLFDETWENVWVEGRELDSKVLGELRLRFEKADFDQFQGTFRPEQVPGFAQAESFTLHLQGGETGLEGNMTLAKPNMFGSSGIDRVASLSSLIKVGPPELLP